MRSSSFFPPCACGASSKQGVPYGWSAGTLPCFSSFSPLEDSWAQKGKEERGENVTLVPPIQSVPSAVSHAASVFSQQQQFQAIDVAPIPTLPGQYWHFVETSSTIVNVSNLSTAVSRTRTRNMFAVKRSVCMTFMMMRLGWLCTK